MEGKKFKLNGRILNINLNFRVTNSLNQFQKEVDRDTKNSQMYYKVSDNPTDKEESVSPHIRTVSSDYIFNSVLQCEFI